MYVCMYVRTESYLSHGQVICDTTDRPTRRFWWVWWLNAQQDQNNKACQKVNESFPRINGHLAQARECKIPWLVSRSALSSLEVLDPLSISLRHLTRRGNCGKATNNVDWFCFLLCACCSFLENGIDNVFLHKFHAKALIDIVSPN